MKDVKQFYYVILFASLIVFCSACNRGWMRPPPGGYPPATPQSPPNGVQAQPMNLGAYTTCNLYAQRVRSLGGQVGVGQQFPQGQQQFPQGQQPFPQGQQPRQWLSGLSTLNFTLDGDGFVLNQVPAPGQQSIGVGTLQPRQQALGGNLQAGLGRTVVCNNPHTCLCANNQFFIDRMPNGQVLYSCIELPTARIENRNVYNVNPNVQGGGGGVIKFALPAFICNQR